MAPQATPPVAPPPVSSLPPKPEFKAPSRSIPPVRPSAQRSFPSEKGRGVSKVPAVPMLFDNEPPNSEAEEASADDKYPEVMLEALHVLDPLCLKWNLSKLSIPTTVQDTPAAKPAPSFMELPPASSHTKLPSAAAPAPIAASAPIPSSARLAGGYLRLLGLLANGSPWECSIPLADMQRQGGVVIGRDPATCSIVLMESSISRRHAALTLTEHGVVLQDMGSTNGSFVNGRRLGYYEPQAILQDGYVLGLGDVSLRVEIFSSSNSYNPV